MQLQGHYGRRIAVREHTTPRTKTPVNAVYRSGKGCIMAEPALTRERVAVRSGTLVKTHYAYKDSD